MKQKFTLFMLAVLFVAAGSFAQGQASQRVLSQKNFQTVTQQTGKNVKQQPSKKSLQMQQSVERQKGFRASVTAHNKLTGKKLAKKPFALRRGAADIISEQPEGTKKVYSRSGSAYVASLFGVYETSVEGAVGSVVFGANDKVYIKNIISQANGLNAWVVGTISGSTITIQLPQTVYAFVDEGYNLEAAVMSFDAENMTYVKSADQTVKLNYNVETGDITTPAGKLTTGEDIIDV